MTTVSETAEQRLVNSEVRPVLLQLGVVHVDCKKLEIQSVRERERERYRNVHNQCEGQNMDFEAR